MKIIFICGSLEPGKNGVGDYTRRLCGELINQGVSVGILSFNDKHAKKIFEENQCSEGNQILCYRLPNSLKNKTRYILAKKWIEIHKPDWLSLQFVPYSFNNKGLPFGIGEQLKGIGRKGVKWQIMFHELWLGMNQESYVKEKLIGYIQRRIIKQLIVQIKPDVIHTQTKLYKKQIEKLGFNVLFLPLFSNIPVIQYSIPKLGDELKIDFTEKYFVLFGSIHFDAPIESFTKELISYLKNNKSFSLVTIGRNGSELQHWISVWKSFGLEIKSLGEQPLEVISYVLKNATYGISTTPMALADKSGSVAAMNQHNLPVICISRPWIPRGIESNWAKTGITEYKLDEIVECLENKERGNPDKNNISNVALSFLENINK